MRHCLLISCVLLAAAAWGLGGAAEAPKTGLAALLDQLPNPKADTHLTFGPDRAKADALFAEILKGGPAYIAGLVDLVQEPGKALDFRPRYALHVLAQLVAKPGLEKERQMLTAALVSALGGQRPKAVVGFIIRQLQVVPSKEAAGPVGKFLLDEELSEYAAQALVVIGGEEAAAQLRQALPNAKGKARAAILQGLGGVRDAKSVDALTKALGDADRDVRLTAAFALAEIADPASADPVLKEAEATSLFERSQATEACLLLGRRLAEAGKKPEAAGVFLRLWKTRTGPADRHVRCAALRGLADAPGKEALETIVGALASDDARVRDAAIEAAAAIPGEEATRHWLAELKAAAPDKQPQLLGILGRRRDPAALPAVLEATKGKDAAARLAAIQAAGLIGGKDAVAALIALLDDPDGKARSAARGALERASGPEAAAQAAAALPGASTQTKVEVLAILTARFATDQLPVVLAAAGDKEHAVRAQAIRAIGALGSEAQVPSLIGWLLEANDGVLRSAAQEALASVGKRAKDRNAVAQRLVGELAKAPPPAKAALVAILGQLGAPAGLDPIREALKDPDANVQDTAVRALAGWPDAAPSSDLLAIAKSAQTPARRAVALRGYIQMIQAPGGPATPEAKLAMCEEALRAARRPDEKKQVLSVLSGIRTRASLDIVGQQLGDQALADEAGAAAVQIARDLKGDDAKAARAVLAKAIETCRSKQVLADAKKLLDRLAEESKKP